MQSSYRCEEVATTGPVPYCSVCGPFEGSLHYGSMVVKLKDRHCRECGAPPAERALVVDRSTTGGWQVRSRINRVVDVI